MRTNAPAGALSRDMRWLLLLCACDAGERKVAPAPMPVPVPVPGDAAIVTIDASTLPTPANRELRLDVREKPESSHAECSRATLRIRLVDKARHVVDQRDETSTCSGACTAAEKRDGERQIEQTERRIEKGESVPSELDDDFTSCFETGYGEYRKVRNVGGRDVILFTDRYVGPHGTQDHALRVATEVCGKLFVSGRFGELMYRSWDIGDVVPRAESDASLAIRVDESQATLWRLHLPACPGTPREESFDVDPR